MEYNKNDTEELIYKIESNSQILKAKGETMGGRHKLRDWG